MKKTVTALAGILVLMTLLDGCARTSQGEIPSIDSDSPKAETQTFEAQDEKNSTAEIVPQDTTVFIDENTAELKMPENNLYEYATRLKCFDYDKVQEAIGQNTEGDLAVDDGNDGFTGGSLTYQRNDMASHLDT